MTRVKHTSNQFNQAHLSVYISALSFSQADKLWALQEEVYRLHTNVQCTLYRRLRNEGICRNVFEALMDWYNKIGRTHNSI